MKNLTVVGTLVLLLSSTSCREDEVVPKRSDEELITVTLEKIAANEVVLNDVFMETSTNVTRTAIQNALKSSATKTAFIANMNALVEDVFENEVKNNSEQLAADVFIKFDGVKGESVKQTVSQFILDPTSEDPLVSYSNKVKSLLDGASGRGLLLLIQKVAEEETSEAAPSEQMSLNFEKIKVMFEMQNRVIASGMTGISAETDSEIDEILKQEGVPPVAIGLLLPAVQKFSPGSSETASLPYWDWLTDYVNPEINGGLNRDIIRRYNAAGFMGALQLLLSDEYKNDNQDLASMLLLRARYQASLMFIWSDIWEKSKLAEVMQARVKSNENILENAFIETAKLVNRKAVLDGRAASPDKASFIAYMNNLVKGVFNAEVQKNSEKYGGGVVVATGDITGSGTSSKLADLLIKNDADPLTSYENLIQDLIDKKGTNQGNTLGDLNTSFTIVNRVTQNTTERESYMSITPASASNAKKLKVAVLYGRKYSGKPIEELRVEYGIPQPLMGMLLPAVQKVREYNGTADTADTAYLLWLNSLGPMTVAGASHDMVTRYDAAGYLGALHFFASDLYRSDNQDYASLLLLKARYETSLVMLWNDLWGK